MECKLVFTGGINASGEFVSEGRNFLLDYFLDGDACSLEYKNGVLTQRRRGSVSLRLEFIEGCESECVIGEGELGGKLPLFCEKLQINGRGGGVDISLEYLLGGEKYALDINIIY